MVFLHFNYDMAVLTEGSDNLVLIHSTFGAEKLRYSFNFGKNWTDWTDWEDHDHPEVGVQEQEIWEEHERELREPPLFFQARGLGGISTRG